jgi:hypothetical protein
MRFNIVSRNRDGFLRLLNRPRHFVKVGRQMPRGDPMPSSLPSQTSVPTITDTQSAMRDNGDGLSAGAR